MPKFLNRGIKSILLAFVLLAQRGPLRGEVRPLTEPRILFSEQEKISEEPECTRAYMRIPILFLTNSEIKRQWLCKRSIIEAPSIAVLESLLEQADRNTLVLWDVDDVLVQPTDAFYMEVPLRKRLYERIWLKYSKTERKALFSHFFLRREVMLVHPRVLEVLKGLEQKGIPCAALTAWWTGPYGSIPKMEDLRFQGLASVGISFAGSCPFNEQRFDALATAEGVPLIQQGVIFTALQDKALVLAAVLEGREKDFSKIIFIEDNISNLKAVEKLCRKLKIPFLGIHYTEAASRPLPQLEPAQEKERFRILEDEGLWLLDEELQGRLFQPKL